MLIRTYAAFQKAGSLSSFSYEAKKLCPEEVCIKIAYCGVCYSDIHLIDNDWGSSVYPQVPGHEIIGEIVAVGSQVSHLKIGDMVGVGWQRSSCGQCESCQIGEDHYCPQKTAVCEGNHGGYADFIQVDGRFALLIPATLDLASAGPLLCGGTTVFTPLYEHAIHPGMKIAVIGIGGLGHLALQFASKMGHEVTAFSGSPEKETEAREFGANQFIDSRSLENVPTNYFDLILCTVHGNLNWNAYINLLKPHGKLCFLGALPKPIEFSIFSLILGGRSV